MCPLDGFSPDVIAELDALMRAKGSERLKTEGPVDVTGKPLSVADPRKTFLALSDAYLKGYGQAKAGEKVGEYATHQLITKNALRLLRNGEDVPADEGVVEKLIFESAGPDGNWKNMRLMMEGHFYGVNGSFACGNYLPKYFDRAERGAMEFFDNIQEDAKSNFVKYIGLLSAESDAVKNLAWALHYVQDLTAPHHVRNFPAYFTRHEHGDGFDTHVAFEKYANALFGACETRFDDAVRPEYEELSWRHLQCDDAETAASLAEHVYQKALSYADDRIKTPLKTEWEQVINHSLPLAIACTMLLLKVRKPVWMARQ